MHVSHKHENLLRTIFHDPISANIHWREVESLLHHVGAGVEPLSGARIRVKLNGVEGMPDTPQPRMTGCHQPCEKVTGTEIPVAWFAYGLRIIDISRPHALKEVAYFMPDVPQGSDRVQSNDVTVDERGLIYLLDRVRGLHILERIG